MDRWLWAKSWNNNTKIAATYPCTGWVATSLRTLSHNTRLLPYPSLINLWNFQKDCKLNLSCPTTCQYSGHIRNTRTIYLQLISIAAGPVPNLSRKNTCMSWFTSMRVSARLSCKMKSRSSIKAKCSRKSKIALPRSGKKPKNCWKRSEPIL